jgi:hypothetical protein
MISSKSALGLRLQPQASTDDISDAERNTPFHIASDMEDDVQSPH